MIPGARTADSIVLCREELIHVGLAGIHLTRTHSLAKEMLAACDGPEQDRPQLRTHPSLAPGLLDHMITFRQDHALRLWAPLLPDPDAGPAPVLRLVVRACREAGKGIIDGIGRGQAMVTGIYRLAEVGAVSIGAGATSGGSGSMVFAPSPFGGAAICLQDGEDFRSAPFDIDLMRGWTIDHIPDNFPVDAGLMLSGISHEPDPDEALTALDVMRETLRLDLGGMLDALRRD